MFASRTIPTSLPPSPMAKTTPPNYSLTNFTIWAFSLGVLLQNITDLQFFNNFTYSSSELLVIFFMQFPSIKTLNFPFSFISIFDRIYLTVSVKFCVPDLILKTSASLSIKHDKYPIFSAVSNLSPVIIMTTMPASSNREIVSGTPSWSLSSIALAPRMINYFSIF